MSIDEWNGRLQDRFSDASGRISRVVSNGLDEYSSSSNGYTIHMSTTESDLSTLAVVAIALVSCGVLVGLVVLCCCCCCRRGSRGRVLLAPPPPDTQRPAPFLQEHFVAGPYSAPLYPAPVAPPPMFVMTAPPTAPYAAAAVSNAEGAKASPAPPPPYEQDLLIQFQDRDDQRH